MRILIIIPRHRVNLSPDEEISKQHYRRFLTGFETRIIKPASLKINHPGFPILDFPDEYFQSIQTYSRLLLTPMFYETLLDYDYILIYQPDALVFSDQLPAFCEAGYDYIGAPIFRKHTGGKLQLSRVGNGGMSLRKVSSFLAALNSRRYTEEPVSLLEDFRSAPLPDLTDWPIRKRLLKKLRILRSVRVGVKSYTGNYSLNEDLFWSDRAKLFYPGFKVAPLDVGLKFSFERHPRYCYELNGRKLPFSCHAWAKWDREFWEPFLLT
jgi:hypothetical protein